VRARVSGEGSASPPPPFASPDVGIREGGTMFGYAPWVNHKPGVTVNIGEGE
jgi:hypothetical protein